MLALASFGYLVVRADTTKPTSETSSSVIISNASPTPENQSSPSSSPEPEKTPVEQIIYAFSAPTGEVIAYNLTQKNSQIITRGPGSGYLEVVYSSSDSIIATRARENTDLMGAVVDLVLFPKAGSAQATVLAESVSSVQPPSVSSDRSAYLTVQFNQNAQGASFDLMKNSLGNSGPSILAQEQEGILFPQWSGDASAVYYIAPSNSQYLLKRVPTTPADPIVLKTFTQPVRALRVTGERVLVSFKVTDLKTSVQTFSLTGQLLKDYGEFDRIFSDAHETPTGLLNISRAKIDTPTTLFLNNTTLGPATNILNIQ